MPEGLKSIDFHTYFYGPYSTSLDELLGEMTHDGELGPGTWPNLEPAATARVESLLKSFLDEFPDWTDQKRWGTDQLRRILNDPRRVVYLNMSTWEEHATLRANPARSKSLTRAKERMSGWRDRHAADIQVGLQLGPVVVSPSLRTATPDIPVDYRKLVNSFLHFKSPMARDGKGRLAQLYPSQLSVAALDAEFERAAAQHVFPRSLGSLALVGGRLRNLELKDGRVQSALLVEGILSKRPSTVLLKFDHPLGTWHNANPVLLEETSVLALGEIDYASSASLSPALIPISVCVDLV